MPCVPVFLRIGRYLGRWYPGRWYLGRWWIPLELAAAAGCLVAGVTGPIMTASWFIVFRRPFSVVDGVRVLFAGGDWLIAAIIIVFSIVFPLLKIGVLAVLWVGLRQGIAPQPRLIRAIESFGRWSMLDVFVTALIVFALKTGSFTDAATAPALYPFVASIGLTAHASRVIAREARGIGHTD
jgi:paraquat-inducible protein A